MIPVNVFLCSRRWPKLPLWYPYRQLFEIFETAIISGLGKTSLSYFAKHLPANKTQDKKAGFLGWYLLSGQVEVP